MKQHDLLLEELQIRGVLERYCRFIDDGDVPSLTGLFEEDCSFEMMGHTFSSRDELMTNFSTMVPTSRPASMHALTNPLITVDGDRATSVCNWTLIDRTGVLLAGIYRDELSRGSDGSWRFSSRRAFLLAKPVAAS